MTFTPKDLLPKKTRKTGKTRINRQTSNYRCPNICRHCRYYLPKVIREMEGYCEKWTVKSKAARQVVCYWTCDYYQGPPK